MDLAKAGTSIEKIANLLEGNALPSSETEMGGSPTPPPISAPPDAEVTDELSKSLLQLQSEVKTLRETIQKQNLLERQQDTPPIKSIDSIITGAFESPKGR